MGRTNVVNKTSVDKHGLAAVSALWVEIPKAFFYHPDDKSFGLSFISFIIIWSNTFKVQNFVLIFVSGNILRTPCTFFLFIFLLFISVIRNSFVYLFQILFLNLFLYYLAKKRNVQLKMHYFLIYICVNLHSKLYNRCNKINCYNDGAIILFCSILEDAQKGCSIAEGFASHPTGWIHINTYIWFRLPLPFRISYNFHLREKHLYISCFLCDLKYIYFTIFLTGSNTHGHIQLWQRATDNAQRVGRIRKGYVWVTEIRRI